MREMLFRGKRTDNGEFVYGDLIHRKIWSQDLTLIRINDSGFDIYEEFEVDPATVGQYTELTDKNGKKIFNGDIVRHYNISDDPEAFDTGAIFWYQPRCIFMRTTGYGDCCEICEDCLYEIIGNIHDKEAEHG